ncbi:hypothetical protein CLV46_2485 [Diaminobutyricimonas aerilata]|uniref:Uncharacterized protein n=1 Tax=Diaminobutyricimonas aerilata TaxID=1162967 RepID=A0A2M9CLX9_9MICO|nr:hypothetical protein [Diaminobutyricimonas aerilata]PJJ72907.1 hypothetical protein CLV46_2485 [Diaminobutyricimonas aerilata]
MKRVYYSSGSVLTGDRLADDVIDYAAALARNGQADNVRIPVMLEDGSPSDANLLLGPASELVAVGEAAEAPDPRDDDTAQYMERRVKELSVPRPRAAAAVTPVLAEDYDY